MVFYKRQLCVRTVSEELVAKNGAEAKRAVGMGVFARLRHFIRVATVAASLGLSVVGVAEARGQVLASVDAVRIGTYDDFTRVVMHVNVPLSPKLLTLSNPDRLIVDLPRMGWNMPRPSGVVNSRLVQSYRFGLLTPSVSRLVFNLSGPAQIMDFKISPLVGKVGYELDIRLKEPTLEYRPFDRYRTAKVDRQPKASGLPVAPVVDDVTRETFRKRRFDPQTAEYGALGALFAGMRNDGVVPTPAPAPTPAPVLKPIPTPAHPPQDVLAEIAGLATETTRPLPESGQLVVTAPVEAAPKDAPKTITPDKGRNVTVMAMTAPLGILKQEKVVDLPRHKPRRKPFRIVIDPGHGGRDPGAGENVGFREASAVLAFSEELMALLEADPEYKAYATRRSDRYVALPDRVSFAREKNASLFISIHADWFHDEEVGGAGAYMLSEKDSMRSIDELFDQEDAGKVAGIDIAKEREDVVRVLLDLERRETQIGSRLFAELVRDKLSLVTPVKRNFVRHNNFHVLKAPDMPSVLLELGFMSNPDDLKRLTSAKWRKSAAKALKEAIDAWRIERGTRELALR